MAKPETYKKKIEIDIPKTKRGEYLERMALKWRDLRATEAVKRQRANEANEELKAIREELDTTANAIASERFIEEVEVFDQLRGKTVETIRADTGQIVAKRPATVDELQTGLFDRDAKPENDEEPTGDKPKKKRGRPRKNAEVLQ